MRNAISRATRDADRRPNRGAASALLLRLPVYAGAVFTAAVLLLVVGFVLVNGIPNLKPSLFEWEYASDNVSLMPALVDTVLMAVFALVLAVPVGIASAVYLVEYARPGSRFVRLVRITAETLQGIPSIIYGLFGLLFFTTMLGWGLSLLSGACTLAIMVLPLIMRTTEEALLAVPASYRQGSFALGAGRVRTVFRCVLPSALPGIVGGVLLALGVGLGLVRYLGSEDLRKKVTDIVEPMDYLLPFFFGVIVFTLYPMVRVFIMAFQQRYKLTGEFVGWGLGNFSDVLHGIGTNLPQAIGNTFLYVILTVPISTAIALLLAYLLNQKIKLRALFQTAYFLPMVTSATAVGLVWKYMFQENYGLINWLLSLFDVAKIPWLTKSAYSMAVMVIYGIWDALPFTIILLISGLQNIDDHYYTVAKVDGARAKRIFFRITVPLLSPTIGLVLIINSISAFKVFNSVVVLFSGSPGPNNNMYTMTYYIYEQINTSLEYGRAAAASLILFVIILLFTMLQRFIQRKWKYD